ncbi:hypothetical protein [Roseivirga echinicomitans]|uniref:Uncharacterized protein n=1 Tax=Roseivirga echinicomitans TaxID=296218 RepID=A0A150XUM0_9BACT|nr:hypothetical protein [Roseivirga echinicomitans]KYG82374.1 hypothetical protein AWN68_14000 [Roseivirga echinicomitans]
MEEENQILKIIHLSSDFRGPDNNQSIYNLLESTGYFSNFDQISIDAIQAGLTKHPKVIEEWLEWSESKRGNSGWYFKNDNEKSVVGYYTGSEDTSSSINYSDLHEACATFIKNEIEDVRMNE